MKKFYFILVVLFSVSSFSQDTNILDTWDFESLTINGITQQSTLPDNTYFIEFTNQEGNEFGSMASGNICYSYGLSYQVTEVNIISIGNLTSLAQGCEVLEEEDLYFNLEDVLIPDTTYHLTTAHT